MVDVQPENVEGDGWLSLTPTRGADPSVTPRHDGRPHHTGIGRTHARPPVVVLVEDQHIRVVDAITGELRRELSLDPDDDDQRTGAPTGPSRRHPGIDADRTQY